MHYIVENNINQLNEICKSFDVKRLYIFGSLSTDKFEELFERKVDLLSRTQVRNPYLQKGIDATKQLIYEA